MFSLPIEIAFLVVSFPGKFLEFLLLQEGLKRSFGSRLMIISFIFLGNSGSQTFFGGGWGYLSGSS